MEERKPTTLEYEPQGWARQNDEWVGHLINLAVRVAVLLAVIGLVIRFLC